MFVFNEQKLREEVVSIWGPAGAHVEVLDDILSRAHKVDVFAKVWINKFESLADASRGDTAGQRAYVDCFRLCAGYLRAAIGAPEEGEPLPGGPRWAWPSLYEVCGRCQRVFGEHFDGPKPEPGWFRCVEHGEFLPWQPAKDENPAPDTMEVCHMMLCEQNIVVLQPDRLYQFTVDPKCKSCLALAPSANR